MLSGGIPLIGRLPYPHYRLFLIGMAILMVAATFIVLYRIAASIGSGSWAAVARAFRGDVFDAWADAPASLVEQRLSDAVVTSFVDSSPSCAEAVGPEAALHLAPALLDVWRAAGSRAAAALVDGAPGAAKRLKDAQAFRGWIDLAAEIAARAPEVIEPVLDRSETLLARVDVKALRGWALNGLRSTAGDSQKRLAYFTLGDANSLRAFEQAASDVVFADVERRRQISRNIDHDPGVSAEPPCRPGGERSATRGADALAARRNGTRLLVSDELRHLPFIRLLAWLIPASARYSRSRFAMVHNCGGIGGRQCAPSLWTFKEGVNSVGPPDSSGQWNQLQIDGIGLRSGISSRPSLAREKEKRAGGPIAFDVCARNVSECGSV